MRKLQIPNDVDWELLVVNNNCTDHTDKVIARHTEALPLRRLFESKPGQPSARNCAVAAAQGELLIWTDDDVLVDSQWLSGYAAATTRYPNVTIFGGPILPWFEGTPPRWLVDVFHKVDGAFAARDLGLESISFTPNTVPFGANFAVRTDIQRRYRYDPKIGLSPGSNIRGDETTMIRRMLDDNIIGRWIPDVKVRHFIPKNRQTVAYLRQYYRGVGEYKTMTALPYNGPTFMGLPRHLWRKRLESTLKYWFFRLRGKPDQWIEHLIITSKVEGRSVRPRSS